MKLMHAVFGIASLVMLITTIWMMADDHNRPWKDFQRTFRHVDVQTTEWRAEQQKSADYEQKLHELEQAVAAAQRKFTTADRDRVLEFFDKFKAGEEAYVKLAKGYGQDVESLYDRDVAARWKAAAKNTAEQQDPESIRAGRAAIVAGLKEILDPIRSQIYFRENNLANDVKTAKSILSSRQSQYDQAVGRNAPPEKLAELEHQAKAAASDVATVTALSDQVVGERKQLEGLLNEVTAEEDDAQKELNEQLAKVEKYVKAAKEHASNIGKSLLELPILDAFNSPLKIENRWLPQLPWNNNFRDVARFDRCETCHQGVERTLPGSAVNPALPATSRLTIELDTPAKPPLLGAFGLQLADASKPGETVVTVVKVTPKSLADDAGLKAKDAIVGVNGGPVAKRSEVESYLLAAANWNPDKPLKLTIRRDGKEKPIEVACPTLASLYGLQLAETGLFSADDVTIAAVYPRTPAAAAGLIGGDVIEAIDAAPLHRPTLAADYLLMQSNWGKPLKLEIRRGVPHPFATHPRLDLFVGSLSPHPVSKFGCTICHQGQGSATAFKWASHTPNSLVQAHDWSVDHQWFNNENWTYPMYPKRFEQSTCLKCHHEVVELERSRDFPDPPAPKLIAGYETIRRYGCFGCHEINGFDGPTRRIGPDLRLEPNYSAAAAELLDDPGLEKLGKQAVKWADEVQFNPDNTTARHGLSALLASEAEKATLHADDPKKNPKPILSATSLRMEGVLKDVETPGTERKVGPSLRHVGSKLGFEFITSWVANPQNFRPDTRMPRFFGQWDHLDGVGLEESQRLEPIEIRAIANYLLKASQPFKYIEPAGGDKAAAKTDKERTDAIARGKKVFQTRGCLACHQHADFKKENVAQWQGLLDKVPAELKGDDFPELKATQGPDLSRIGAKLALTPDGNGRRWLYSWVRNPSQYHPRTFMPVLFLLQENDAAGKPTGSDPADDVTEFLMSSQQGWKPDNALSEKLGDAEEKALDELALDHLSSKFSVERAKDYLVNGIPASQADVVQGDEAVLINPARTSSEAVKNDSDQKKETDEQKKARLAAERRARDVRELDYVGRRTIGKYGCFGCHDIPGYEDSKTIGTALADWGRKLPARLAFEQIDEYVKHYPNGMHAAAATGKKQWAAASGETAAASTAEHGAHAKPADEAESEFKLDELPADIGFFTEKLLGEEREGFLWQKLRAPRSFDFKKTENKNYNDRLRMPKFHFATTEAANQVKIEQVMTFVLGLVSEPPPPAFIYHPAAPREAIVSGRKVLEKFNCAGCHILEMERWDLEFKPGDLGRAPTVKDFPFDTAQVSPKEIDDSKIVDRRGTVRATIVGMPKITLQGTPAIVAVEDEDNPDKPPVPTCTYMNFQPAAVDGGVRPVGKDIQVPLAAVAKRYPAVGGDLARYALPFVVANEPAYKEKPNEAWGWLPPPLVGEGKKVQTEWLHDFLMDPFRIRPAAVLRMPKFNMSSADATKLAAYFAAMDGAEYPYEFDDRTRADHLAAEELVHPKHLEQALGLVVDSNFCVKCHKVGDYSPTGTVAAMAPRLDRVHGRLRPEYAHRWIGDPATILPYTGMPQNFPPPPAVPAAAATNIYPGTSEDQIDALVDLLMNFDRFAQEQISIKTLVKPAAAAPTAPAAKPAEKPAEKSAEQPPAKPPNE